MIKWVKPKGDEHRGIPWNEKNTPAARSSSSGRSWSSPQSAGMAGEQLAWWADQPVTLAANLAGRCANNTLPFYSCSVAHSTQMWQLHSTRSTLALMPVLLRSARQLHTLPNLLRPTLTATTQYLSLANLPFSWLRKISIWPTLTTNHLLLFKVFSIIKKYLVWCDYELTKKDLL